MSNAYIEAVVKEHGHAVQHVVNDIGVDTLLVEDIILMKDETVAQHYWVNTTGWTKSRLMAWLGY